MTERALTIRDDMSISELGSVLAKSGFFSDTRDAAQAIVKVLAGREMGFGPIQSMTGINIIQGRVAPSANLMAAAVKRSGKYNYRIVEHSDKVCEIMFTEQGQDVGHSRFTLDDAKKAGTKNLDKFPRNMLFARAMSNGVRWYTPDVFSAPVYTPEELGADIDEAGEVIKNVKANNAHEPALSEPNREPITDAEKADKAAQDAATIEPEPFVDNIPLAYAATAAPVKLASVRGMTQTADWKLAVIELAAKFPQYQTSVKGTPSGQPNMFHVLGAAAKCGYPVIDDNNYELVIEAIATRAAEAATPA